MVMLPKIAANDNDHNPVIHTDRMTSRATTSYSHTVYSFGLFRLHPQRACLERDGQEIKLRPKSFELLHYLVRNPGRLLTKQELIETIWPDSFVTEDSLVQCVRDIRRTLGPDAEQFIKTLPRRGYMFDGAVMQDAPPSPTARDVELGQAVSGSQNDVKTSAIGIRTRWAVTIGVVLVLVILAVSVFNKSYPTVPAGLKSTPLTTYRGFERNPSISPDGKHVAFTWNGKEQDNFDIYVLAIGSDESLRRLTDDRAQDTSPAWSHDGRSVAFLRRNDDLHNQLILVPSSGGPERVLVQIKIPIVPGSFDSTLRQDLAWSQDGLWIVVTHCEKEETGCGLYAVSTATGEMRALTRPQVGAWDENPAISRDRKYVAFARHPGGGSGGSDLYLVPVLADFVPSGPAKRITSDRGLAAHPMWADDTRRLFYVLNSKLHALDLLAQKSVPVSIDTESVAELSLGHHLVYSKTSSDSNLCRAEIPKSDHEPAKPHLFISSTRPDNSAQYSPDGTKVVFRSSRSGTNEIWIGDADGTNFTKLFVGPGVFFPSWSPDGKRILFHMRLESDADIFSVSVKGGTPKRLTSSPSDDFFARESIDGWVYFTSNRSGRPEIWRIPVGGGNPTQVTHTGGRMPVPSADGKSIYYGHRSPEQGIWKIPAAGGDAVKVTGPVAKDPAFAINQDGIYYAAPPESPNRQFIYFLNFGTGKVQPVVMADHEIGVGLSLSPDNRFLVFPQRDVAESDLMLVRDFALPR
jgi:Tol biopolymer transport system component/DNA-binding winged helix-turn-helix (wHTH) protein